TAVRYAGYNAGNAHCGSPISTTINGVAAAITSVNIYPAATMSDPNGSPNMVCAYDCGSGSMGGCNTPGQVAHYFLTHFGGTMRLHQVQYGCWSGTQLVSAGGNCCLVNQVLPVELNYFSAICTQTGKAKLTWETASETNNHFFTVERSDNGIDFYPVARINGAGTSSQPHQYTCTDETEIPEVVYYRLRQTDFNGQTEVFPVRALNRNSCNESTKQISVFPNPAENTIVLQLHSPVETSRQIICSDMSGRVLFSIEKQFAEGENVIAVDISALSPGTYTISIAGNAITDTSYARFLKQ
ncbi:MAG: T9SS type A sorting domain-containing protein, partial [Bacteroidia bacterium]